MSIDQLIFVGLNGYAAALDRDTGGIVWSNYKMELRETLSFDEVIYNVVACLRENLLTWLTPRENATHRGCMNARNMT